MEKENKLHSGIVAIVGRPNTGKSTLLNSILGEKVTIVSKVPQTTRNKIRGIFTDRRGQIVFIDTPGMHLPKHRLGSLMVRQIEDAIDGSDLVIHLVDSNDSLGEEERLIIDTLNENKNLKFIYFSSILAGTFDNEYYKHKIKFENLIKSKCGDYMIIRAPQIIGENGNKNNIVNTFKTLLINNEKLFISYEINLF